MSSKSSSTRNRRNANGNAKSADAKATPASATPRGRRSAQVTAPATGNKVVARRLALIPDKARKAAAVKFAAGEPISKLAAELGVTQTHAAYALRQELVETGKVTRLDASNKKAVKAAIADGKFADRAWIECRTGRSLTSAKLTELIG